MKPVPGRGVKLSSIDDKPSSLDRLAEFVEKRFKPDVIASDRDVGEWLLTFDTKDRMLEDLSSVSDIAMIDEIEYDPATNLELSTKTLYSAGEGFASDDEDDDDDQADDAQVNSVEQSAQADVAFDHFGDEDVVDFGKTDDSQELVSPLEANSSFELTAQNVGSVEPEQLPLPMSIEQSDVAKLKAPVIEIDESAASEGIGSIPESRPYGVNDVIDSLKGLYNLPNPTPIEEPEPETEPEQVIDKLEHDEDDDDDRLHVQAESMTLIPDQSDMLNELRQPLSVKFAESTPQLELLRQQVEMMWNSNVTMNQQNIRSLFDTDMSAEIESLRLLAKSDPVVEKFEEANASFMSLQEDLEAELDNIYSKYERDLKAWLQEQLVLLEKKYREERPDTETEAAAAEFIEKVTPILEQESTKLINLRSQAQNQMIYAAMQDSQKSGMEYTPILTALSCISFKHSMEDILYNAERAVASGSQTQMQPVQPPMAFVQQPVMPADVGVQPIANPQPASFVQPIAQPQAVAQPVEETAYHAASEYQSQAVEQAPVVNYQTPQDDVSSRDTGHMDTVSAAAAGGIAGVAGAAIASELDDKLAHSQHAKTDELSFEQFGDLTGQIDPVEAAEPDLSGFDLGLTDNVQSDSTDIDLDNLPSLLAGADDAKVDEVPDFDLGSDDLSSIDFDSLQSDSKAQKTVDLGDLDALLNGSTNTGQPQSQSQQDQQQPDMIDGKPPKKKKMSLVKKVAIAGVGVVLAGGIACGAVLMLNQPKPDTPSDGAPTSQSQEPEDHQELASKFAKGDKLQVGIGGNLTDVAVADVNEYGVIVEDASGNQYQISWSQLQSYVDSHPDEFKDSGDGNGNSSSTLESDQMTISDTDGVAIKNTDGSQELLTIADLQSADNAARFTVSTEGSKAIVTDSKTGKVYDNVTLADGTSDAAQITAFFDSLTASAAGTDQTQASDSAADDVSNSPEALTSDEVQAASTGGTYTGVVDGGRG